MFKDKSGKEIKAGNIIYDGFNAPYTVKEIEGKLFADNGGHMFPLESSNYNLKKFCVNNK